MDNPLFHFHDANRKEVEKETRTKEKKETTENRAKSKTTISTQMEQSGNRVGGVWARKRVDWNN